MITLYESKWDTAARKAYHAEHPDNFAGPDMSYPIRDSNDVKDAWAMAGHAADPDAVRAKIKAIAKRLGLTAALPDTATAESVATVASSTVRPRAKIATLKVCFLEYNARSLNGRIYPKATCDAIFAEAQRKLADTSRLPITCYVNHAEANSDDAVKLVGRITRVWQEAAKFYADIDLADTRVGRDVLALASGGYIQSESMRVMGVETTYSDGYDLPIVVAQPGATPELMGIDLTARPGLQDTARIMQVLYESTDEQKPYIEAFALDDVQIEALKGADPMPIPLYLKVLVGIPDFQEALTDDRMAHKAVHDNLAGVLDAPISAKHAEESARFIALVEAELSEEGKAIAKKHASKIAAAHDASAHQLGIDCEGCYKEALGIALDPDQDGDGIPDADDPADKKDDGMESAHAPNSLKGGNDTMTPEEMMEELKKQGFTIAPPKTKEQELQESFDAKLAEQERKFEEKLKALAEANPPQRQTQALNGTQEDTNP